MTHVKKKHMTRWGLEPGTYHRPCKYSDHLANGPHDEPASSSYSSCTPSKVCLDITRHIEKKGFLVTELI